MNPLQHSLTFVIRAYRLVLSPAQLFLFGPSGGCRFTPSCSQFALEAIQTHGAITGSALAAGRICRCHPWAGGGHDPVPQKRCGI
ncbi:MAG TPA: membrane protein insertion efficiency factor YidD [Verrucomicrobiae bacterium]